MELSAERNAALQRLSKLGAKSILIVNVVPLGCTPALLTIYYQDSASNYDGHGCLKNINRISKYHNTLLANSVNDLRHRHQHVTFYLADYYRAYRKVLRMPSDYGIPNPLRACCGCAGSYNFNNQTTCGHIGPYNRITNNLRRLCLFPSAFANWDGVHPSQRMNLAAATAFFLENI
uniref:Uncharacterized protein n=1 Tax=Physcomitrium patens TaxID=3218 RepID=A0A2K1J2L5_PHYPA|nr:hypothetical protein PHYPA_021617 [Physcomitrium patens]